jgi:hypothetical protein
MLLSRMNWTLTFLLAVSILCSAAQISALAQDQGNKDQPPNRYASSEDAPAHFGAKLACMRFTAAVA